MRCSLRTGKFPTKASSLPAPDGRGHPRPLAGWLLLALLALFPGALRAQSSEDCLLCHSDSSLTMTKQGRKLSLFVNGSRFKQSVHGTASCTDCHEGLNPDEAPHAKVIRPVNCQNCHDVAAYERSVHGRVAEGSGSRKPGVAATCKDCHGTHQILSPSDPKSPTNRSHLSATCGKCHESVTAEFARSSHGVALESGVQGAPACVDCHGEHNVEPISSMESPVYKSHEARVCLHCHLDNPEVRERVGPSAGFIGAYEGSVHGVALAGGNDEAATCSDCHGAHDMKQGRNATSRVNKWNIPGTCGRCHAEIAGIYNDSTHGKALQWGNKESPSCTDCHGEHQIYAHGDPRSRVAAGNVAAEVCAPCHASVALTRKYGLPEERFKSFEDSYHGLASKGGSVEVANCASCHGVHNIKPSTDPASMVNKANLAATCGSCHPGAGENFTKGSVHIAFDPGRDAVLYWVRTIYISLIVVVIGGMLLHNLLDFIKKSRHLMAVRSGRIAKQHYSSTQYLRLTVNERIQHALLFTSFIVLVITGFMLKFPDAWWVYPIRQLSEKVFEVRSLTHRIAGVVLMGISFYHLGYVIFSARGRGLTKDFLPRLKDLRDFWNMLKYNTGLSRSKPKYHRFGYIEKAEYWALLWGTALMAVTGIILWFDNYFINLLTKLGWDVANTIHYYEAVLATLAVVVWHFYYVIFNPDVYPMSRAWWTGRLTEEEMANEHPLELEEILTARRQAAYAASRDKPREK